ncbi:MAG: hypothetical protein ABIH46_11845, partial [Chloroflexota bacterium]
MTQQKARHERKRSKPRPSRRSPGFWRRFLQVVAPKVFFGALLIALATASVLWLGPPFVSLVISLGELLAEFFGLGLVLLFMLALVLGWLIWRRQFVNSLRWWNRWLAALVFGLAAFGLGAFFGGGAASAHATPLIKKSAGGLLGQAIIGNPSVGGVLRLSALCLFGAVILSPDKAWAISHSLAVVAYDRLRFIVARFVAWLGAVSAQVRARRKLAASKTTQESVERGPAPQDSSELATETPLPPEVVLSRVESDEKEESVAFHYPSGGWEMPPYELLDRSPETEL